MLTSLSLSMRRLESHANVINEGQSANSMRKFGPRVSTAHVRSIFEGLSRDNAFAAELTRTGGAIMRPDDAGPIVELSAELTATINRSNNFFEVAAFSADNARGNRSFCYSLQRHMKKLDSRNCKVVYVHILQGSI